MPLSDCRLISLPKVQRPQGNLTALHGGAEIPFRIERVYWLYDVPAGVYRGAHSHRTVETVLIAAMGGFTVTLSYGEDRARFTLRRPDVGLYVPPLVWRELDDFTSGSVCLVLASERYDEAEYIRDFGEFMSQTRKPFVPSQPA